MKIDKSDERRMNLSGSWQQGHSAAYNTAFELSRLQMIYPNERLELTRAAQGHRVCSWGWTSQPYA